MAIYHCSVSNVSRAAGSSSVASLSYITAERMRDEYWGKDYNGFGRRERVVETRTLLPEGAPAEWRDAARLFNGVEMAEKAEDARTAKKIVVALPVEFTPEQRREALEAFIRSQLTARGYAATYAIHEDAEGRNPHAHILVPNRPIDPKTGTWARYKQRSEYVLDSQGQRVPLIDPKTGEQKLDKRNRKQWKRRTVRLNPLDARETLQSIRKGWADECNRLLPEAARISHLSNEARGIDLEPTMHEGYAAREIEKRGGVSDRCEANREIRQRNRLLTAMRDRMRALGETIHDLTGQIARILADLRRKPNDGAEDRRGKTTEPGWRRFEADARRQLEADRAACVESLTGDLSDAERDMASRRSWLAYNDGEDWKRQALPSIARVRRALDDAGNAGLFARGRARRELEAIASEEASTLRRTAPWLRFDHIPTDRAGLEAFNDETRRQGREHELAPYARRVSDLQAQIERAKGQPIGPEQIERLARELEQHGEDRPLDLSEPEDRGKASPFESRRTPRTKADLFAAIERKVEEKTGEERQRRQEREQTLDDLWEQGQWNNPGHGFSR